MPNYVQRNAIQSTVLRPGPVRDAIYSASGIRDTAAMKPEFAAMAAIEGDAPTLAVDAVARAVDSEFGLGGDYSPLVSERDQNFMLRTDCGERYVVNVTSRFEDTVASNFQIAALRHLELAHDVRVPKVYPTLAGGGSCRITDEHGAYRLRVVTWVDGAPLESQPLDVAIARDLGAALARLDRAFDGFSHPGEHPVLLWDLQRAAELRSLLSCIDDSGIRARVARVIDDFKNRVRPAMAGLRTQVIHGDPNPGNVLSSDGGIGFIDFGDSLRAPLVFDVAIAASYLRTGESNPLQFIVPFAAAYHAVMPLDSLEGDLLFDLVRARLATTVTLLHWRLSARGADDPYRQKALEGESGAAAFLARLDFLGRRAFRQEISFIQ